MVGITNFIANFKDGARPNRFRVIITWPALVGAPNVEDYIVVSAAQGPESTIGLAPAHFMGRVINFPGDRVFAPWQCQIVNSISYSHRNTLERWVNLMNANEGNAAAVSDPTLLWTTIAVQQLGRDDAILKTWLLRNAFPNNVAQVEFKYESNNTLEEYQVTFNYSHWDSPDSPTS